MPALDGGVLLIGGCGKVGHMVAPFLYKHDECSPWISAEPRTCSDCKWDYHLPCDAMDVGSVFHACRGRKAVIYMAMGDITVPRSLFDVGLFGWYNTLIVAKELSVPLVLLSSLSVYDDWYKADIQSEHRKPNCDDPYGVVKVQAEQMARHFSEAFGISIIVLRLGFPLTMKQKAIGRRSHRSISDERIAAAILSAVGLENHTGFDIAHICGQESIDSPNLSKAKELLGWEP